jgi:hypothetical protein
MSSYNFILITIIVLTVYFLSFYLTKIKKITQVQHRRFWNLVLLITFLASCLLGLFLAFSIDQQLSLSWYLPLIWYHVEFSIVMSLVAIFHALWHLPYYKSIFKRQNK